MTVPVARGIQHALSGEGDFTFWDAQADDEDEARMLVDLAKAAAREREVMEQSRRQ